MITGEDIDRLYEEANRDRIHEDDTTRTARRAEQMMRVSDPLRAGMPALTSMLFMVCGNNHQTFERATKLVEAFMDQAEKEALEMMEKLK